MKRMISFLTLLGASAATQAVPLIDVKLAAGAWSADIDGDLGRSETEVDVLDFDSETATFISLAFEHPVPVIPNVLLKRTELEYDAITTLSESITLRDRTFSASSNISSSVDLSHTDLTLYYGLPEVFLDLDFGLTVRNYDGDASISSETQRESIGLDVFIPMLFAQARLDLPFTGFYFGAQANGLSVGDNDLIDYSANIGYSSDTIPFIADLDVEIGYRSMALELDDDELGTDITIDGPYLQFMLAF